MTEPIRIQQSAARPAHAGGFTLLEALVALVVVLALLAILLPSLYAARRAARLDRCAFNQQSIGVAWTLHLRDHAAFPQIDGPAKAWKYAGVDFSRVNQEPMLDYARPLNRYLSGRWQAKDGSIIFASPIDRGIRDPGASGDGGATGGGTGGRSAYGTYGTSYRANDLLFDAEAAGLDAEPRPLRLEEVTADPADLLILGAPVWHEAAYDTRLLANWYGEVDAGNALFLDGSVRFIRFQRGAMTGPGYTIRPAQPEGPKSR